MGRLNHFGGLRVELEPANEAKKQEGRDKVYFPCPALVLSIPRLGVEPGSSWCRVSGDGLVQHVQPVLTPEQLALIHIGG